jgi:hypothetical protein
LGKAVRRVYSKERKRSRGIGKEMETQETERRIT